MNVKEINPDTKGTLGKYFATALPLTILTAWVITAFQSEAIFPEGASVIKRLLWPFFLVANVVQKRTRNRKPKDQDVFSISAYDEEGVGIPM